MSQKSEKVIENPAKTEEIPTNPLLKAQESSTCYVCGNEFGRILDKSRIWCVFRYIF